MSYYTIMFPVCNTISELLLEQNFHRKTLKQALTHLSEGRAVQALELVCQQKKASLFSLEKSALIRVEEELAMAIVSQAQTVAELKKVYQLAELSIPNKVVVAARVYGLTYRSPTPIKEE